METTALAPTSLPNEPATGKQNRVETPPSGEFAKILQNQPAQADKPDGKTPENPEEDPLPAPGEELPLLLSSLPAILPQGKGPFGEKEISMASSDSQKLGKNGAPQILEVSILTATTKDGATAGVPKKMLNENPSSSLEKAFNLGLSANEGSFSAGPPAEILNPENRQGNSLPAGKAPFNSQDPRLQHNLEAGEKALGDLKNSAKAELANFDSEFWIKEKDLFQDHLNPVDLSKPGNLKTGDLLGSPAAAVDGSAAPFPAGESRLEEISRLNQPRKSEVYEQVSQKMVWSFSQNEEKFRLILDPPHLGSIYMEIQRDKEQIKATLWAENPNTKQILESSQLSIQKIIESEGFSLESFDVFVEQDLGAFQESRERMRDPEPATFNPAAEADREPNNGAIARNPYFRESGGRFRAIDLII